MVRVWPSGEDLGWGLALVGEDLGYWGVALVEEDLGQWLGGVPLGPWSQPLGGH